MKQHLASCQHHVCIRKKPRRSKLPERLFTEVLALGEVKFKLSHDVRLLVQFCKTPALAGGSGATGWEQERKGLAEQLLIGLLVLRWRK